ncbi:hypothetical protein BT67DRAFT_182447 [Trichocladium antarcticum]|uniref:Secreted protein n=1 Tax=Trichocladium antarcticum TaxID=1450529 RepID=A0AAN6ZG25_9PEZI|nr:hypothetical protein BT67DRAFT_182447 [Trichocladium antarcticum]
MVGTTTGIDRLFPLLLSLFSPCVGTGRLEADAELVHALSASSFHCLGPFFSALRFGFRFPMQTKKRKPPQRKQPGIATIDQWISGADLVPYFWARFMRFGSSRFSPQESTRHEGMMGDKFCIITRALTGYDTSLVHNKSPLRRGCEMLRRLPWSCTTSEPLRASNERDRHKRCPLGTTTRWRYRYRLLGYTLLP